MPHCGNIGPCPISRREMLRTCATGFGAIALTALLGDRAFASEAPLAPHAPQIPARAKNIIFLYMDGGPDRFVMQGWEPGHGDFLRKVFFMKRVLRYDRQLVEASREDAELKRRAAAKLDARLAELDRFRARKSQERETFTRARREQEKRLASLQSDEQAKQRALAELEHVALARPHFLSLGLDMLPSPSAEALRVQGLPVVAWTVRSARQWARVRDGCDNLMFEGFKA